MKKPLSFVLIFSIIGISAYFIARIIYKNAQIERVTENSKTIDWFEEYMRSNDTLSQNNTPTVLIYFNPDCEFCQHEAIGFYNYRTKLGDANWYWISDATQQEINNFSNEYKLTPISRLHFIHDSTGFLWQSAGATTIPYILVYNSSGNLTHKFSGETKIEAILLALE
ncbi:hypothetical protein KUV50_06605 [Membranicola marinus]|uniref:Thioredoxin domain-containing protein n=1 Tax=Membranihabitans marinus TaxID=1227546 RepID=A0A953L6L7_9BACT|nr:hypothetical protein [Membranihabitans marinus]MBY5957792.1 hypothetical protein [Membranihabitans marinus]